MKKTLLLLSFLVYFEPVVFAQNLDVVEKQILRIGVNLMTEGFELTHDIKYISLNEGSSGNYYFSLERGTSYIIVAVCDGDCGDVDLCLYDENNNEIDCDLEGDDLPIVKVNPKWSGRFKLRVTMYDCDINPCKGGIAVFGN